MKSIKCSLNKSMYAAGSRLAWSLVLAGIMTAAGVQAASLNVNIRVGTTLTPGAGTISPTNSFVVTTIPQTVTLTAVESNPAYYFDSWALLSTNVVLFPDDGSQTTNDPAVTVRVVSTNSGNVTINAMYKSRGVALNIVAVPTNGGYTVPSLGTNWYALGATTPPITATASNRYEFTGWTGAANTPANPTTVFMDTSKQLEANFIRLWTVSQSKRTGPSAASPYVISLRDQTTTNLTIPNAFAEQTGSRRYRCNGWTAGTGSVSPPTQLGANFTSVDLSPLTTNTAWTWAWQTQFAVTVITNPSGYISVQELGSDNDPNDMWADSNTFVRVTVTAFDPSKYEPDYVSVNGTRFDLSGTYQVDVLVTNAITLASSFRTSSQDDPGFVAYMTRFGLKAGNVGQRTFDDPDNDGLSNQQEYQLSVTNKSWYFNPINSDTDGDGMDDKYEYESVDSSNLTEVARASYRPSAVDNGSGSVDNGPEGNPDGDYHWSTTDGYMHREQPFMNIEEYRGPDNIAPYTNAAVNFGDAAYPFASNPVGNRPTVYVRVVVAGDTGDQSKGNAENSDRDTYDDGFEYSWDQWQHWGRTNVASLIGGTQEVFMIGVTNMVGIYYTNTIPNWATTRVFNPGHTDVVGNGPDNDVLYDYQLGKVSQYWYDASREYNVWRPDALSPGIAGAPSSIRMDSPPNGEASPRRCSHPFMWDVDLDGLPDGYEVVFGYDPWANRTIGHTVPDGQDNPDDDWMAWAEANNAFSLRNREVYVSTNYLTVVFPCTNYDPRVAVAQFYPTPNRMPGPGTEPAPKTKRYSNADEMRGAEGIMTIVPVAPGVNIDDATHPFKVDSDDDGIWDGWENYVSLNASSAIDAGVDGENDGLNSLEEFQSFFTSSTNRSALLPVADWNNKIFPSDPNSGDSDGDKVGDGGEKRSFNGIAATATNIFLDETGMMTTQAVAVSVWSGSCYLSGGLNPTSSDTDADTLPDPYEASYPGGAGLDGTIRDAFGDPDRDKLPNYIEYYTCAIMPWQQGTPSLGLPVSPDDYFGGTEGTPKAWDWSQQIYIPLYPDESGVGRFGYSGTCPNMVDSDEDGMDDYYEIYHGICPVYGIVDEMLSRIMARGRIPAGPPLRPFVGDIRTLVFVSGTPMMDPDGDGLPNSEEAVNVTRPFLSPQYHTDPSPLWVTDMGYVGSWVNKYYTTGNVWPWCGPRPPEYPPLYAFDFESNEGFDSDNDGYSDREELVVTQTDPLSPERPIKRRALYLPAEKDAYARTFPGFVRVNDQLRSFTVEAWVRPINPASGMNQTIVERPIAVPAGNALGGDGIRVNFRLGIDPTGLPYIAYNGEGAEGIFYIAKAGTASRVSANNWAHLAGTYSVPSPIDPSQRGVLTLYVNGQMAAQTNPNELPATARYGNNPSDIINIVIGAPIIVGASDGFPIGDMDANTRLPSPAPFDFFKGWVDEVRVWDGARTLPEVVTGMKMRMKQVDVINSQNTTVPMEYHFSFDDLPDPDRTPTAPAGLGFDVTGNYIFPSDYTGVGFWATEASRSQVYAGLGGGDPRYVPWIWNTVAHTPLVPPTDIGNPNAVVNLPDGTNAPIQAVLFPNTTDLYGFWHKTYPSGRIEDLSGFIQYDDLLPLAWAEADEDIPMWDAGGTPAVDPFSSLGDGIPDAWKEQHGFDPFDITVATADPDRDGLNNYYEYLCGTDPKQYISGSDSLPDSEQDSDGDMLSNITELQRGTMPNIKDTDDDGLTDWEEVSGRADPSWVRPATSPAPRVQTDPLNPLSPAVQRSVYLDGNARLIVPPSDKLLSKNWTVEAWVNPDTNSEGGVLVSRFVQGFTADEYGINYEVGLTTNAAPAGMLRPYARFMMMTNGSPRESRVDGLGEGEITNGLHAVLIPTGTWSHIVGVCNSTSNTLSLYVNGRLASYRTDLVALPLTVYGYGTGHRDDEVTVGASRSTGAVSNGFKGYLDNVRIWSGANNAEKILDRYNAPEGVASGSVSLPLKSGAMTTLGGLSEEVASVASTASIRMLVKFADETAAQDSATLTAAGIQVLNYVAPGVRAVKATQQQVVALGDKVSWTGLLKSSNKISPLLNVGGTTGSRYVLITFFGDVAEADAVQAVQAAGGSVFNGKYIAAHDLVAQLTDAQLVSLAGNNAVSWAAPAAAFLTSGATVRKMSEDRVNGLVVAPFVNLGNGWDGPGRGSAKLTYHFVITACNLPETLAKKLVVGALYKWAQYADLTFAETDQIGLPRSIDIGWLPIDGPGETLGLGYPPSDINPESTAGDFILDNAETWQDGISGLGTDLNQVALHEEGHCLGMDHSDDPEAIMYPFYNPSIAAVLSPDDIAGIQAIYAAAPERFGLAEFRFDDGGFTAQDFVVPEDWKNGWASAAWLDGAVFATNTVAPLNKDSDGDGLPDWWEMANGLDAYSATGINGAYGDPDSDGLNNLGEYLAGTDPHQWSTAGNTFSDYDSRQGPGFRTFGELYDDGDWIPDAWETQYRGPSPTTNKRGLDPAYYDAALDADEDGWDNYSEYLAGCDPLDHTNFPMPQISMVMRYSGKLGVTLDQALATQSPNTCLRLSFYHKASMDGHPDLTLVARSSIVSAEGFTGLVGTNLVDWFHLWQGSNYVFAYLDVNGDADWSPTNEPAGIAQSQPINVQWGSVNTIEIGLTDTMPGYPRFSWPIATNVTSYTVSSPLVTRTIQAPRNYFHEGDWLAAGLYGVTTGDVITPWSIYADGVAYTNVMMPSFPRAASLVPSEIVTDNGTWQFDYALNEFLFKVDTNATAYRIQIAATSNAATPLLSYTNVVPYMDLKGQRTIKLPFYVGDNYVPPGGSYASSVWNNGQYWVRVQGFTRGVNSSWSPWSSIMVNVQPSTSGGKSMISGDLYYFGKVSHGYGTGQTSNLTMIVQAYESPGFSSIPDGQVQVSYQCNTNAPSVMKGLYSLKGLRNVPYYVRAFIDLNGNRQLDAWEPFGFVQDIPSNGFYHVAAVDLSGEGNASKSDVRIVIRDRDTDDDGIPDGWEWMYYGALNNCSSNMGVNGLTLLRNYEIEPADLDPTKTDYDGDGVPDQVEIDWTDAKAGVPVNSSHTLAVVNWSNLTTVAGHVYNPYDPVSNPRGTDLNPIKWDTDGDGLSDGYEITHGYDPLNPADGAAQIARASAAGETIAGIPKVSQVAMVTPGSGQFMLSWQGQIGMNYEVQYSNDLKTWQTASGNPYRYGAVLHTYLDDSPRVNTRFYRVVVK